jgi:hypothetical protein
MWMCDFCGCPAIDPFSFLTDEHVTLLTMADAYASSLDPRDLDALAVIWADHRAEERMALEPLAEALALHDALALAREADAAVDGFVASPDADAKGLRRAVVGHVDTYEYEVFPQLVMAADPDEIDAAARRAAEARVG